MQRHTPSCAYMYVHPHTDEHAHTHRERELGSWCWLGAVVSLVDWEWVVGLFFLGST